MSKIIRSPSAESDLLEIWGFIAQDSPTRADQFLDRLEKVFRHLAGTPLMGRARDEVEPGLRSFAVDDYLIFYRPLAKREGVEIARVIHAARDIERVFEE